MIWNTKLHTENQPQLLKKLLIWKTTTIYMGGDFLWGRGVVPDPILFCIHLLVRVKLGYTTNFTLLSLLEVLLKFFVVVGRVGGGLNQL